jgi:hypothetical protein
MTAPRPPVAALQVQRLNGEAMQAQHQCSAAAAREAAIQQTLLAAQQTAADGHAAASAAQQAAAAARETAASADERWQREREERQRLDARVAEVSTLRNGTAGGCVGELSRSISRQRQQQT